MKLLEPLLLEIVLFIILIGILVVVFLVMSGQVKFESKWSLVGFIGPFPFGAGNDKEFLKFALIAALIFFVIVILSLMKGVFS